MTGTIINRQNDVIEVCSDELGSQTIICNEFYHPEIFKTGFVVKINIRKKVEVLESITVELEGYHVVGRYKNANNKN